MILWNRKVSLRISLIQLTCIVSFSSFLIGCVHPNKAQVEWTKTLRQLGVAPTYPPREDVFVGDVYLSDYDPNSKITQYRFEHGNLNIGIEPRWTHVNVTDLLNEYDARYVWPATPNDYDSILGDGTPKPPASASVNVWHEPTTPKSDGVFAARGKPSRLEIVEMPDFANVVLTKADANAAFPVQGVQVGIAVAASQYNQVVIKVPAAESYSVNAASVLSAMLEDNNKIKSQYLPAQGLSKGKFVWLRVITEVYYARAIDITGSDQIAVGGHVDATVAPPAHASSQTVTCLKQDEKVPDTVVNPRSSSTPGGTLVVTHCDSSSITLRRVFEQPIAIGTRGFVLKINAADDTVANIKSSISGISPAAKMITTLGLAR
ncbi:hypothetical protein [Edaphobacter albus]|uniref:hypothetical protein n=1 Tax=Edaphobacter sp. 4G125 TaxID=2763071 RepID=UPI0016457C82|nr:hypothetical protein [Edaphobacter sp. 4G125]QNI36509.1 hypothetical protein H7846_16370 [Edaphobacter sp. 4G125]